MKSLWLLLLLLCAWGSKCQSNEAVQIWSKVDFECVKSQGRQKVVIQSDDRAGGINDYVIETMRKALDAKMMIDLTFFGCFSKNPTQQANLIIDNLPRTYNFMWLMATNNSATDCAFKKDQQANCDFLRRMVYQLRFSGIKIGIKSIKDDWNLLFGETCKDMFSFPLFYKHVNSSSSFEDWDQVQFGGWQKSQLIAKGYTDDLQMCGDEIKFDYYP